MTRPFEITRRYPNRYYVDADPGLHWLVMSPQWLDPQTLQLGLSSIEVYDTLAGARRSACVRASVPQLKEALQWCADRRMGAKLVSIEVEHSPELIQRMHEVDVESRALDGWSNVANIVLGEGKKAASHRLVFKHLNHALEFKLRWY